MATDFHRLAKLFELIFFIRKTFHWMVKTRQAKSSSQPVNLPGAQPLLKPLSPREIREGVVLHGALVSMRDRLVLNLSNLTIKA